jgi:hypothetical protein
MRMYALAIVAAAALFSPVPASPQTIEIGPGGVHIDSDRDWKGPREGECEELRRACLHKDELGEEGTALPNARHYAGWSKLGPEAASCPMPRSLSRSFLAGTSRGRERAVRRSALEPHDDAALDEVRKLVGIPVRHADAAMQGVLVNLRGVGCAVQAVGRLG